MFAERVAESVRKDAEKNEDANIMITGEQKRRPRRRLQRMVAVIVQYKRRCWVTRMKSSTWMGAACVCHFDT